MTFGRWRVPRSNHFWVFLLLIQVFILSSGLVLSSCLRYDLTLPCGFFNRQTIISQLPQQKLENRREDKSPKKHYLNTTTMTMWVHFLPVQFGRLLAFT